MRTTIMVATIGSTLYTGYFKKLFSSSFSTSNLGTRRGKWQRRKQSRYSSESTTSAAAALLDSSRPSNERYTKKTNNCLPEPLIRFQIAEMRRVSFATRSKTFSCYREPRSLVFHLSTQNEKIVYGCLYYAGKRFTVSTNSVIYSFLFGIPVYFERINWSILILWKVRLQSTRRALTYSTRVELFYTQLLFDTALFDTTPQLSFTRILIR